MADGFECVFSELLDEVLGRWDVKILVFFPWKNHEILFDLASVNFVELCALWIKKDNQERTSPDKALQEITSSRRVEYRLESVTLTFIWHLDLTGILLIN